MASRKVGCISPLREARSSLARSLARPVADISAFSFLEEDDVIKLYIPLEGDLERLRQAEAVLIQLLRDEQLIHDDVWVAPMHRMHDGLGGLLTLREGRLEHRVAQRVPRRVEVAILDEEVEEVELKRLRNAWLESRYCAFASSLDSVLADPGANTAPQTGDENLQFIPGRRVTRLAGGEGGTAALLRSHLASEPSNALQAARVSGMMQDVSGLIWLP